ncbi:hypothetical protein HDU67_004079 [Dinochytrium kinnereticum]|nr:hypothetical protein HDU67_004079 [Dinochytrium kinnereticum]
MVSALASPSATRCAQPLAASPLAPAQVSVFVFSDHSHLIFVVLASRALLNLLLTSTPTLSFSLGPSIAQPCAPGTVCCAGRCLFPSDAACGVAPQPIYTTTAVVAPPATTGAPVPAPVTTTTVAAPAPSVPAIVDPAKPCAGIADGKIACLSSTTFNICVNGALVQALPQPCPATTVCCQALSGCTYPSQCPVAPPAPVPVTTTVGTTTVVVAPPVAGTTTVAVAPPVAPSASASATAPVPSSTAGPIAPSCVGVGDDRITCTSTTTFNICKNGFPAQASDQACQAGLVCCATANACVFPGQCPSAPLPNASCLGIADNRIACTSATTFNICQNGVFANAVDQRCQAGLICCTSKNQCINAGEACPIGPAAPPPTASATAAPVNPGASCAGIADGKISCLSTSAFNICQNGAFASALPQYCQAGLECCTAANACLWPGQCATYAPVSSSSGAVSVPTQAPAPSCSGIADGRISCLTTTTFNTCQNGVFTNALPQSCPAGLTCCTAANSCVWPGTCPIAGAAPPTAAPGASCAGVSNGRIACLSATTFNVCENGVFANAVAQSCPASTVCCGATSSCVFPGQCPVVGALPPPTNAASCTGVPNGNIACLSNTSFNICANGVFANAVAQSCQAGLVCCAAKNACVFPGECAAPGPAPAPAPAPISGPAPAPVPEPLPLPPVATCAGVMDGKISCLSSTTFNFCVNGAFVNAVPQSCAAGTVCCGSLSTCVMPGSCPVVGVSPPVSAPVNPASCAGVVDGRIACISSNTFNICANGGFALAVPQTCQSSLVCCAAANSCVRAGECPTAVAPPAPAPPAPVVTAPVYPPVTNVCASRADGQLVCLSSTTFNYCRLGGFEWAVPQSCAPGTVCCGTTSSCIREADCPAVGVLGAVPEPTTSVVAPVTPPAPAASCSGVGDGRIACLSPSSFNICQNGAFALAVPQTCQTGLYCCAASNSCVRFGECPVANTPVPTAVPSIPASCAGVADNKIRCLSETSFNICYAGAFANAVAQGCPAGTVCCESANACVFPGTCPVTGALPPPSSPASCSGISDGKISCLSSSTFNVCQNGVFANAVAQSCPSNTVCCTALSACVNPGSCPITGKLSVSIFNNMAATPSCSGVADGRIACLSSTSFNVCQNGVFAQALPQYCVAGLECCDSLNACVDPRQTTCPSTITTPTTSSSAAVALPTEVPASCAGIADGRISCLSSSTFNVCQNGVFANAVAQSCPAGLTCCTSANACVFPGTCPVTGGSPPPVNVVAPTCQGVADGKISCLSATTFNVCLNGAFANALPQSCQAGLQCCSSSNACVWPGQCATPPLPPAPAPVTPPSGGVVDGSCAGIADDKISCLSSTTFNICKGGVFAVSAPQSCYPGLVCCTVANSCVWPGTCPAPAAPPVTTSTLSSSSTMHSTTETTSTSSYDSSAVASHTSSHASSTSHSSALPSVTAAPSIPFDTNGCLGTANDKIGCTSSTSFNICLNGAFFSSPSQNCQAGLVCCAETNSCEWASACPDSRAKVCHGVADRTVICTSSTTYNVCLGGLVTAKAFDTACPAGYECCAAAGGCVVAGSCDSTVTIPTLPDPSPNTPAPVTPPAIVPVVDRNSCLGTADGNIACTGDSSFNTCQNGAFSLAVDQVCVAGLVCCAATNRCDYAASCPVTFNRLCNNVPNNGVVCTAATTYNICIGSVFAKAADSVCPAGHVCCPLYGGCVPDGSCVPPAVPPPTPPVAIADKNACLGTRDNAIGCTGPSTFNVCSNGFFSSSLAQGCPAGLVCCASSNSCEWSDTCAVTKSSKCVGVPDQGIVCNSATTYNVCLGGLVFAKATDTACPAGTECCALKGGCVTTGTCTSSSASDFSALDFSIGVPAIDGASYPVGVFDSNPCLGTPANSIACTGSNTINICNSQGTFDTPVSQTCPGANTFCCASKGSCEFKADCPALASDQCAGVADNAVKCTSATTYNVCIGGVFAKRVDTACPIGFECCGPANGCVADGTCKLNTPPVPSTTTSTTSAHSTSSASTTHSTTMTMTASSPAPTATYMPTCAGAVDGAIRCKTESTFNFCLREEFLTAADQACAPGTICCLSTQKCDFYYNCPGYQTTPQAPCTGRRDGDTACTGPNTFNFCYYGVFISAPSQTCAPGTVCCANSGLCDFASNCASTLTLPAPTQAPVPTSVPFAPNNCVGQKDGTIGCLTPTTFNVCENGQFAIAQPQSCPRTLVCCPTTRTCNFPGQCSFTGPVNPVAPPPLTCAGQPDGTTVCTGVNTINFCINGEIIRNTPSQLCAAGTVCCAATGRCDFVNRCPAVGSGPVTPPPVVAPAPGGATCAGKPDNTPICTGPISFNVCIGGSVIRSTPDQPCPSGTVCCVATGRCDFAAGCPAIPPPSTPVAPVNPTVPSVPVAGPVASCSGAADGAPVCTGPNAFNYCSGGKILPFTADQPCAPGTVCCGATGRCDLSGSCVAAPVLVRPPAPAPTATVAPAPVTNFCAGKPDAAIVCVSETSLNYCLAGQIMPNTPAQPCPNGTICCPALGLCSNRDQCAEPFKPPTATTAPAPAVQGEVVVPYVPKSCVNVPDGEPVCTGDLTFNLCKSGLIVVNTPDQYCAAGTICCGILRRCVRPAECPLPNPCTGKTDGSLVCTGQSTFNLCSFGQLARAADQTCAAGTVCCPATGTCDRVDACKPLPRPTPSPIPSPSPSPRPSPSPVVRYGDCSKRRDGETTCVGPLSIGICQFGRIVDAPAQACPLGTVCCIETGRCDRSSSCPSPAAPSPSPVVPSPTPVRPSASYSPPSGPTATVPLPTVIPPIVAGNCTGKADYERVCSGESSFIYCRNGAPIPNQAINACPSGTSCCASSNSCVTRDACSRYVPMPSPSPSPLPPAPEPGTNVCAGRPNGATICNGDKTFAVCLKGEVVATQTCAGNSICCGKTQSCDFKERCDGLDLPYIPPSSKCYGVLNGFSVCSDDLSQVFTCERGGIANTATCPQGSSCCKKTSRCETIGSCPDVCAGKYDGVACVSSNQFSTCSNGVAQAGAVVTCAAGTICCDAKSACTWPRDCYN